MKKTVFLTTLLLLGCSQETPTLAERQLPEKLLSVCDQNKAAYLQRSDLFNEPITNVIIERQFQRVIRLNCDGTLFSDKIETVQSPRANVILKPSKPLQRDASIVKLLNSETCDNKESKLPKSDPFIFGQLAAITGEVDGIIKVKMDMAEALFTYKVTTGLNQIYYSYYNSCESEEFPEVCGAKHEIRSGVHNVFVNYSEKTLPGQKTVFADNCQKKK